MVPTLICIAFLGLIGLAVFIGIRKSGKNKETDRQFEDLVSDGISKLRDSISDPVVRKHVNRILSAAYRIKRQDVEDSRVKKCWAFYLPKAEELLASYVKLDTVEEHNSEVEATLARIVDALCLLADGLEVLDDRLQTAACMDICADIGVLKESLETDGMRKGKKS